MLVLADGYIPSDARGLKMINTYVALITCLLVGTKLLFVFKNVVSGVLKKLDIDHAKGSSRVPLTTSSSSHPLSYAYVVLLGPF